MSKRGIWERQANEMAGLNVKNLYDVTCICKTNSKFNLVRPEIKKHNEYENETSVRASYIKGTWLQIINNDGKVLSGLGSQGHINIIYGYLQGFMKV
jgi:hypothetical protein